MVSAQLYETIVRVALLRIIWNSPSTGDSNRAIKSNYLYSPDR